MLIIIPQACSALVCTSFGVNYMSFNPDLRHFNSITIIYCYSLARGFVACFASTSSQNSAAKSKCGEFVNYLWPPWRTGGWMQIREMVVFENQPHTTIDVSSLIGECISKQVQFWKMMMMAMVLCKCWVYVEGGDLVKLHTIYVPRRLELGGELFFIYGPLLLLWLTGEQIVQRELHKLYLQIILLILWTGWFNLLLLVIIILLLAVLKDGYNVVWGRGTPLKRIFNGLRFEMQF